MADPSTEDLRSELAARARAADVPPTPARELAQRGLRQKKARAWRTTAAAAAVVALVIGVGAVVAKTAGPSSAPPMSPSTPTGTADPAPRTLQDLPVGDPSDVIHVAGWTVTADGRTFTLPDRPSTYVQMGRHLVLQYPDWSIAVLDTGTGRTTEVAPDAAGPVATDDYDGIVYQKSGDGRAVVVVHKLGGGPDIEQEFPFVPSCCDNPFQIAGADFRGQLVAYSGAGDTWIWNYRPDGLSAAIVPPVEVTNLGDRHVDTVTANEIVLFGPDGFEVGQIIEDAEFVANERLTGVDFANFEDTANILLRDGSGKLHVRKRTHGLRSPGVPPATIPGGPRDVVLDLPRFSEFPEAHWEVDDNITTHVVLEVPARASGEDRDAQVRCDILTGACEIAGWFDAENEADLGPTTPCSDLPIIRADVEVDTTLDAEHGYLRLDWTDPRGGGEYSYVIDYRDDQACEQNARVQALILGAVAAGS